MSMAHSSSSSSLNMFIVGLVFLLVIPHLLLHVSCKAGFSDELINGDSPKSHPTSTTLYRLDSCIRRSASYADYLRTANPGNANTLEEHKGFSALVTSHYSHYLVSFQIGSKKHNVSVVLEVAEDFTWLFCKPCLTCPEPEGRPIYDPSKSTNYYKWGCKHANCDFLDEHKCDDEGMCHFIHRYNPGTAIGTLSGDTLTMRSPKHKRNVALDHVKLGCTNEIEGNQFKDSMGVLGLGSGKLSFVSQMGARGFDKRFSYCLPMNIDSSSYLFFGTAYMPHSRMKKADLDSSDPPFHKITLTGIDVGTRGSRSQTDDNIVISTSMFYTFLDIKSLLFIREQVMQRVDFPEIPHGEYALCYNFDVNLKAPKITLIFSPNQEFVLEMDNAFFRVDNLLCLAILSNVKTRKISVLGSLAQKGNRMLFDVDKGHLHFARQIKNC